MPDIVNFSVGCMYISIIGKANYQTRKKWICRFYIARNACWSGFKYLDGWIYRLLLSQWRPSSVFLFLNLWADNESCLSGTFYWGSVVFPFNCYWTGLLPNGFIFMSQHKQLLYVLHRIETIAWTPCLDFKSYLVNFCFHSMLWNDWAATRRTYCMLTQGREEAASYLSQEEGGMQRWWARVIEMGYNVVYFKCTVQPPPMVKCKVLKKNMYCASLSAFPGWGLTTVSVLASCPIHMLLLQQWAAANTFPLLVHCISVRPGLSDFSLCSFLIWNLCFEC